MGGMCSTESGPQLVQAARDNDLEEVTRLLAAGEDVNVTDEVRRTPGKNASKTVTPT